MADKKRIPIPEGWEGFRHEMWLHAELFGVIKDAGMRQHLAVIDDYIVSKIMSKTIKRAMPPMISKAHTFWQMFKQRYLAETDIEYFGTWGGKDIKIATNIIEKLEGEGATVEEYVTWLFDDFFVANKGKININHNISLSNAVLVQFMSASSEKLKLKNEKAKLKIREGLAMNNFRSAYRQTQDESLMTAVDDYGKGKITLDELEKIIEKSVKNNQ
jgi:hypothetical protein